MLDLNAENAPDTDALSLLQYNILRGKGTEGPGTGKFNKHKEQGEYTCAGCGEVLYT